jgi:photosystem II stability/assembly factor-like uncharacterized protein
MKKTAGLSEASFGEPGFFWMKRTAGEGDRNMIARVALGSLICLSFSVGTNGQRWERLGPAGGTVLTLGTGAGGAVYLGTADGHVFAKEGEGKAWELRGRIGRRTDAVVARLVGSPEKPGMVFAAVWYQEPGTGGGVFHSEDGGRTWKLLGLQEEAVRALEFAGSEPRVMVAGTRRGVFRSCDEGKSWERISPEGDPELRNVDSLAIDPRDAKVIYAGTYHLPWKTTDGGKSWKAVSAGLIDDSDIMSLRVDATNPDRIFLSACSGIYRSENQGGSWSKLQGIPYVARRTQAIVQDAQNPQIFYAGTTEGLWVTEDAGESWSRNTPKDWVVNSVALAPTDANGKERIVIGTESAGVQMSEDFGKTFVDGNGGFTHVVVRQLVGDRRDAAHLWMIMEREGKSLWESGDSGSNWSPLPMIKTANKKSAMLAGEIVEQIFDSPWGCVARLSGGQLWILDQQEGKWREWKLRVAANPESKVRLSATVDRRKTVNGAEHLLLAGSVVQFAQDDGYVETREGLLRCKSDGHCARLKAFGLGGALRALQVSTDGAALRAVVDAKLVTSEDGGQTATWHDLPVSSNGVLWVNGWEWEGNAELFLGTTEGLFVSVDRGESWKRCAQGMPAGQVEKMLRGSGYLAVTLREGGLYVSGDDGQTWNRADQDSERSRFTGLAVTAPGKLTIGSQSEGILRLELVK